MTYVLHYRWIILRIEDQSSDEMNGRENDAGYAGVSESNRQKRVGHVNEETNYQSGGKRSAGPEMFLLFGGRGVAAYLEQRRQVDAQSHLQSQQSDQHGAANTGQPYLVHARSGDGRHQN